MIINVVEKKPGSFPLFSYIFQRRKQKREKKIQDPAIWERNSCHKWIVHRKTISATMYFGVVNISNINKKKTREYFIAAQRSQQVRQVYVLFIEIFHARHVPLSLQMNK